MGSLLKRIVKRQGAQLPTADERARIARAAHAAVAMFVPPDLISKLCLHYARAAQAILWTAFHDRGWSLQGGTALLWTGHEDYAVGYDVNAAKAEGHAGLEFHAWLAKPHQKTAIVFDVATRHFAEVAARDLYPWRRGELLYLYGLHGELWKAGDQYRGTAEATASLIDGIGRDEYRALGLAAVEKYRAEDASKRGGSR